VPNDDPGINKPFDRVLKAFADEAPGLLLRLLGMVAPEEEPELQPLRPETAPAVVMPDYVAVLRDGNHGPVIFHTEFVSWYYNEVAADIARYGGSLAWQYQMPVQSVLVLLRPDGVPPSVPEVGHYDIGGTQTRHPFKVVRLWQVDPTPVLETSDPKLLPWALAMKSTEDQVKQIAAILAQSGDQGAVGRFLTLGSLRYDRGTLIGMLGEGTMGLLQAIRQGSSLFQEERAEGWIEGRAEGHQEGHVEGLAEGLRHAIRHFLRSRFPSMEQMPELDDIASAETLDRIYDSVLSTADADAIRRIVLTAANKA
jgi:hypothetical protein